MGAAYANAPKERFCCKCGDDCSLEIHHIIPVVDGGTDDRSNLEWLCHRCHFEYEHTMANLPIPFGEWIQIPPAQFLVYVFHEHMKGGSFDGLSDSFAGAKRWIDMRKTRVLASFQARLAFEGLSEGVTSVLVDAGITAEALLTMQADEISNLRGIGKRRLTEIAAWVELRITGAC